MRDWVVSIATDRLSEPSNLKEALSSPEVALKSPINVAYSTQAGLRNPTIIETEHSDNACQTPPTSLP